MRPGIFREADFQTKNAFLNFLAEETNRRAAHAALMRFLAKDTYVIQAQDGSVSRITAPIFDKSSGSIKALIDSDELPQGADIVAMAPPLFNEAQGHHGHGITQGYFRAAIAPGDVGGAAAGGEAHQDRPLVYWVPIPGVDQQWKNIFTRRPSSSDGETYEGAAAIFLYKEIKLGDKPELAIIEDTSGFVKNVKHGAAVSIFRVWIEDNKVWDVNRVLECGRRDGLCDQASAAYTALKAANFATKTSPDTSWVKAINAGIAQLKDYGTLTEGVRPLLVCSPWQSYIFVQLKHDRQSFLLTGNQTTDDFDVMSTRYFADGEAPRLLVPGEAMYWQDRQALRQDSARDIFLDADATTFDWRGNFHIMTTKGKDATTGRIEASASLKQGVKLAVTT